MKRLLPALWVTLGFLLLVQVLIPPWQLSNRNPTPTGGLGLGQPLLQHWIEYHPLFSPPVPTYFPEIAMQRLVLQLLGTGVAVLVLGFFLMEFVRKPSEAQG